jgi:hypothetical protein
LFFTIPLDTLFNDAFPYYAESKRLAQERELAQQRAQGEQDRRHQELMRLAREQEDRIREEGERELRIQEQTEAMGQLEDDLVSTVNRLLELWAQQPDTALFSTTCQQMVTDLREEVYAAIGASWEAASSGAATPDDWAALYQLRERIEEGIQMVTQEAADQLSAAAARQEAERLAAQEAAAAAARAAQEAAAAAAVEIPQPVVATTLPPPPPAALAQPAQEYDFPYEFHAMKDFKARYVADVDLSSDKKLKSELTQAVNTTLNAVSATSREHLRDKLNKLTQLLAGQVVEINERKVCAAGHPSGVKFCMAMLAKRIVKQGKGDMSTVISFKRMNLCPSPRSLLFLRKISLP